MNLIKEVTVSQTFGTTTGYPEWKTPVTVTRTREWEVGTDEWHHFVMIEMDTKVLRFTLEQWNKMKNFVSEVNSTMENI